MAEGLSALAEHVSQLHSDAELLYEAGRVRGGAVVDSFAVEQAAAFLILLDLARVGWKVPQELMLGQIKRFYSHRQRGMYVEAYEGRPADLAEIEKFLHHFRRSHFLDGPNDVDWIFRNEIDAQRESALYVDFIASEDGDYWESPADRSDYRHVPNIVGLVESMNKIGLCTTQSLNASADTWAEIDIADRALHWQTVLQANQKIISHLEKSSSATESDARRVTSLWIHPLNALDFSPLDVKRAALDAQRARVAAEWSGNEDPPDLY